MPRKGRNVRVAKTTRRSRRKGRKSSRSPTGDIVGLGYGAILGNVAVGAIARSR